LKKALEVVLGILASAGGFIELGCIATATQAGALFGFQLLWAVVLGGVCVAVLVAQSARLRVTSGRTFLAAVRLRFGLRFQRLLAAGLGGLALLVLAAEIGGVSIALEFATDISYRWWVVPVALGTWLVFHQQKFAWVEQAVSVTGLVAACFVVAVFDLAPDWSRIARATLPTLPEHDTARYWWLALAIVGASVSRGLFFFCSARALDPAFDPAYIRAKRRSGTTAVVFGTVIAAAVLIVAALMLLPRDLQLDRYWDLPLLLKYVFGTWGIALVAMTLAITCSGAALRVSLVIEGLAEEALGKGSDDAPRVRRFQRVRYAAIALACAIVLAAPDPLQLAIFCMVLTAIAAPVALALFVLLARRAAARPLPPEE
jgi:Mn2+/Fe2+ NRAMP family transporter